MKLRPLPLLVLLSAGLALACGSDPLADDTAAYVVAMQPILEDNRELANEFLQVAARIHQRETDDEGIIERWDADIVPLGNSLHTDADAVNPTTLELQGPHEKLVASWADRADSYEEMRSAYQANDDAAFNVAWDKNVEAKLAEEQYFNEVNAVLGAYGYRLDQFPATN
jgi:hypothetical protein